MLTRLKARMLLDECTGRHIWSLDVCRQKGIPETWIDELPDCHESGFNTDDETIYVGDGPVNQYHGIHDLKLAYRLAEFLGVDSGKAAEFALGWTAEVRALKDAVDEG